MEGHNRITWAVVFVVASSVGERVKELREQRRLTQEALAARIGVTRKTVSNWEIGETKVSTAHLPAIALALRVQEADLVGNSATGDPAVSRVLPTSTGTVLNPSDEGNVSGRVEDLRGPDVGRRPIYRWGSLGDPRDHFSAPYPDRLDYPPLGREHLVGPNGFGVEVRGSSMVGRDVRDGDICWINPDRSYRIGDLVLALLTDESDEGGMVIKTYARADVGDCLMSEAVDGRSTVVCDSFKIIGPVVWIERGFPPR